MRTNRTTLVAMIIASGILGNTAAHASLTGFDLGDAANYVAIFQGGGGNQLNINNPSTLDSHTDTGNIGIAGTGSLQLSGPLSINGNVDFAGTVQVNDPSFVNGTISGNHANVQTDMNTLNSLSVLLGGEAGTSIALAAGGNVNAALGTIDGMGNSVFTVSSINAPNGNLTVTGDGTHKVVINITAGANNFHFNNITLLGGLTADDVLFNVIGGSSATLSGGQSLSLNSNGGTLDGVFLDPFGDISVVSTILDGRVYGGDSQNEAIVSGGTLVSPNTRQVPDAGSTALLLSLACGAVVVLKRKLAVAN